MILLLIKVLHFYFLMKRISILYSPPPTMPGKKELLRNALGPGRIFENSGKIRVFVILNLSTPVLDERVIMSSICLATVYDDSNKLILDLRCTDGYIWDIRLQRGIRRWHMQVGDAATLTVSVCRLRIAVVIFSSGHALCCVWLHVQDPRKLQIKNIFKP